MPIFDDASIRRATPSLIHVLPAAVIAVLHMTLVNRQAMQKMMIAPPALPEIFGLHRH
ncbi:MAG: hypothetical protein ACI83P_001633, partial [Janthinobacterium sp.]